MLELQDWSGRFFNLIHLNSCVDGVCLGDDVCGGGKQGKGSKDEKKVEEHGEQGDSVRWEKSFEEFENVSTRQNKMSEEQRKDLTCSRVHLK